MLGQDSEMLGRGVRCRSVNKLHVAVLLLVGFLVGYWLVPRYAGDSPAPVHHRHPIKLRDPAISYTSSGNKFVVEGKEKLILSGAIHYFRVVPAYWKDRLTKLKAAGLNTVETYMPWNLHEPSPGHFDFSGILDVTQFISMARNLGLHVIVRPGPYICSEWDLGGLPPWLLHDPTMRLRSMHPGYLKAVEQYFIKVFSELVPLQSSHGGPIIAFQLENELAEYPQEVEESRQYLLFLYKLFRRLDVTELLFTSDGQNSVSKSLQLRPDSEVLLTINFMNENGGLEDLKQLQPDKPLMVMEFWTGWFDHWNEPHLMRNQLPQELAGKTSFLLTRDCSINYYMFHGGTNFGFMNGANWGYEGISYLPTITSYDYDAPISESGALTDKYIELRKVFSKEARDSLIQDPLPPIPPAPSFAHYGEVKLTLYIPILDTLQYLPEPHLSMSPLPMELLPLGGWGQNYGFVLYRTTIPSSTKSASILQVRDFGIAMVDSKPVQRLSFFNSQTLPLLSSLGKEGGDMVLDILVENAGRVNYGDLTESRKGIIGGVHIDGKNEAHWKTYSLEFKQSFIKEIDAGGMWQRTPSPPKVGPSLFKGTFTIPGEPQDTFIDMKGWEKAVVFVNEVNLGRFWNVGPQRTLYVPAPVLKRGMNKVMVFEMFSPKLPQTVVFVDEPKLSSNQYS